MANPNPLPFTPAEAEQMTADEIVAAAVTTFGPRLSIACSFQQEEAVILDVAFAVRPDVRVFALDTGFLFPETYETWRAYEDRYGITIEAYRGPTPEEQAAEYGERLWERDPNQCCAIRKVEPLDQALHDLAVTCWASGVRGKQTDHRRTMEPLQLVRGRWALRPLLDWGNREVYYYMQEHNLPQHPLFEQGYSTVGDWHSSAPDDGSVSGRATRFGGLKQECGIHLPGMAGEGI